MAAQCFACDSLTRLPDSSARPEVAWHNRGITPIEVKLFGIQEAADRGGVPVAAGLYAEGLTLARVDAAGKAHAEHDNKRRYENDQLQGKPNPRLRQAPNEGELVAVNKRGTVFRINPTFIDIDKIERAAMTGDRTPTLSAALANSATARQQQKDDRQGAREARQTLRQEERRDDRLINAVKRAPGEALKSSKDAALKVMTKGGVAVSLSSFVESLFGMGKAPSSPDHQQQQQAPQTGRGDSSDDAWEEIYAARQQARNIPEDSIRHLSPADLENLRRHGDAHVNHKLMDMERQKAKEETLSWEDHLGRSLER